MFWNKKRKNDKAEEAAVEIKENVENAAEQLGDDAADAADKLEDAAGKVADQVDDAADAVADVVDQVDDAASKIADQLEDAADKVADQAGDAADKVADVVDDVADKVADVADQVADAADKAADLADDAADKLTANAAAPAHAASGVLDEKVSEMAAFAAEMAQEAEKLAAGNADERPGSASARIAASHGASGAAGSADGSHGAAASDGTSGTGTRPDGAAIAKEIEEAAAAHSASVAEAWNTAAADAGSQDAAPSKFGRSSSLDSTIVAADGLFGANSRDKTEIDLKALIGDSYRADDKDDTKKYRGLSGHRKTDTQRIKAAGTAAIAAGTAAIAAGSERRSSGSAADAAVQEPDPDAIKQAELLRLVKLENAKSAARSKHKTKRNGVGVVSSLLFIAAVLCAVYGAIVVMTLGTGNWFNFVWLIGAAVLMIFSFTLSRHSRLPKVLKFLLFLALVACIVNFGVFLYKDISFAANGPGTETRWVIILGAKVNGTMPSVEFQARIEKAAEFVREADFERTSSKSASLPPIITIVTTGGQGEDEGAAEGDVAARVLRSYGFDSSRLLVETVSASTQENLKNARDLIIAEGGTMYDDVVIVTSTFHLYRAIRLANSVGFQNVSGLGSKGLDLLLPHYYFREYAAIIKEAYLGRFGK